MKDTLTLNVIYWNRENMPISGKITLLSIVIKVKGRFTYRELKEIIVGRQESEEQRKRKIKNITINKIEEIPSS
jgi:hypothetical protein